MFDLLSRLRDPSIFQGTLEKRNYFEGWYFKHTSSEAKLAVIPGVSLTGENSHAFIQIFEGGTGESHYISYSLDEFQPTKAPFSVKIGDNRFSLKGIELDIDDIVRVTGSLDYSEMIKYGYSWRERGVMGWYGYVPFLETYHGLISLHHRVDGVIEIDGDVIDFRDGRGYIEKDWGSSFPSSWIWMQSNGFKGDTSLMVSVAVIPWLNSSFIGHLAILLHEGKIWNLSTYKGGKITKIEKTDNGIHLTIQSKDTTLSISAVQGKTVSLKSPEKGLMTGRTIESLDSNIHVSLQDRLSGEEIFQGSGTYAGLEIMDEKDELIRGLNLK